MSIVPEYSIIVHVREQKMLSFCLGSLIKQTIPENYYEVLLIDGGDEEYILSDELKKIFSSCSIKYLFKKGAGSAELYNLGIKAAKGKIVFFTESNCVVPKNWLEEFIKSYERYPDIVGVGGWQEVASSKTNFLQRCEDAMDNKFGVGILDTEIKTNLYFFPYIGAEPANLSYKKSTLKECGGFDENLRSSRRIAREANIRVMARGYPFLHLPLRVKRIKNFGLKDFFYQHVAAGRDSFYLHRKYSGLINDFYGGFFNNLLRIIAYAELNHFYAAYFFSTLFRIGGRVLAKYWERPVVKEVTLLPNKIFEILKRVIGEGITVKTSGRPFSKSTFQIKESTGDFYSIVIPTYNRAESLIKALENLVNQTILSACYEIIVVDDGSTDDTETKITNYKLQITKPEIRYFKIKNGGPAKARNKGIKESKGEIIFFTDDDCIVQPNWMATLLDGYRRYPEVVGVGGWHIPPDGELEKSATSRYIHYRSFYSNSLNKSFLFSEVLTNDPIMFFGTFAYNTANVCYKKEVLQKVGGFREDFYWPGSEDNELAFRIASAGHLLLYLPFHVIHPKDMILSEFIKLHFHRGANGYLLRTIHKELLEKLKPDFINDYGSVASFVSRFSGPEKFLALFEWLSLNAGITYMKHALKRRIVTRETRVGNHF